MALVKTAQVGDQISLDLSGAGLPGKVITLSVVDITEKLVKMTIAADREIIIYHTKSVRLE